MKSGILFASCVALMPQRATCSSPSDICLATTERSLPCLHDSANCSVNCTLRATRQISASIHSNSVNNAYLLLLSFLCEAPQTVNLLSSLCEAPQTVNFQKHISGLSDYATNCSDCYWGMLSNTTTTVAGPMERVKTPGSFYF